MVRWFLGVGENVFESDMDMEICLYMILADKIGY